MENQKTEQRNMSASDDKGDALGFEKKLGNFMANINFSGSVLIVKNNKVEIIKGYSMADLGNHQANGPDTVFQIGSLTKAFTAAAILKLQEDGKLNINDTVAKYIKDYPYEISLYQLLTHTSGIPNFTEFPDYPTTMNIKVSTSQNVAKFKDRPLDFQPGTQFHYSNSGYILLGQIIEVVSGQTYGDYVQEHIFSKLSMTRSGYLNKDQLGDDMAKGYWEQYGQLKPSMDIDMTVPFSAGGVYSTVNDLYKWIKGLEEGKVVSAASWQAMRIPNKEKYALGWQIPNQQGMIYQHGGNINGFSGFIYRDMQKGSAVIILSNVEGIQIFNSVDVVLRMLEVE
jgi:CubicO group peptidase (beta-lactamase class C family)